MSKVSLKNDTLPTFEPLNQTKVTTQKRKRNAAALNDTANGSEQQVSKKAKAKRNTVEPIKSVVWIGATLMEQDKSNEKSEEMTAAFSIFYGLNDKRNVTEKVTLKQDQALNHVYVMGAIRALENCGDENSVFSIYTGNSDIQTAIDQEKHDTLFDEIKEKISKRKGITVIRFKDTVSSGKNEEQTIANKMAADKLLEDEAMNIDNEELSVVGAKADVSSTTTTEVEETVIVEQTETGDVEMIEKSEEVTITNTVTVTEESSSAQSSAAPSWADTLNLRNLLDILKAPFVRNKRN